MSQAPSPEDQFEFFVEGSRATMDDVKDSLITVLESSSSSNESIHAFNSEETFRTWAARTEHKDRVRQIDDALRRARELEHQDHKRAEKLHKSRAKWIEQELDELARDTGLEPRSAELFSRASIEAPLIEGPVTHTAFCCEHRDGSGGMVPLQWFAPIPDFRWFNMNDKVSSLYFTPAGGVLTEHIWYRGRSFWFFGMHLWSPPMQLSFVGFEDIASAGYVI